MLLTWEWQLGMGMTITSVGVFTWSWNGMERNFITFSAILWLNHHQPVVSDGGNRKSLATFSHDWVIMEESSFNYFTTSKSFDVLIFQISTRSRWRTHTGKAKSGTTRPSSISSSVRTLSAASSPYSPAWRNASSSWRVSTILTMVCTL